MFSFHLIQELVNYLRKVRQFGGLSVENRAEELSEVLKCFGELLLIYDHVMPHPEESPRLVGVEAGLVPKAANDVPSWFYARPGLIDLGPVIREQLAPQFDGIHTVLVGQESEPAQVRRAKAVGEILRDSADWVWN